MAAGPPRVEDEVLEGGKLRHDQAESGDEATPTTTLSECSESPRDDESGSEAPASDAEAAAPDEEPAAVRPLGPGLFDSDDGVADGLPAPAPPTAAAAAPPSEAGPAEVALTPQETLFIFDWDDTILPSSWLQRQGLRLDSDSAPDAWQQARLAEAAAAAAETLRLAKLSGGVVLLTNAERGWVELSCLKFVPTLLPLIEGVKIVSARTNYEEPGCASPLQWKQLAFEAEIALAIGAGPLRDPARRKNVHSLGDSVHEREALLRATAALPNCRSKSLKFVDRPDISQLLSQHNLISGSFAHIVQHDGNLDLAINCM